MRRSLLILCCLLITQSTIALGYFRGSCYDTDAPGFYDDMAVRQSFTAAQSRNYLAAGVAFRTDTQGNPSSVRSAYCQGDYLKEEYCQSPSASSTSVSNHDCSDEGSLFTCVNTPVSVAGVGTITSAKCACVPDACPQTTCGTIDTGCGAVACGCADGRYCIDNYCRYCPAGTYGSGSRCVPCEAGYYCPERGARTACAAGTTSTAGASSCRTCPAGQACANGQAVTCSAGTYAPAGSSSCSYCAAGTYSGSGAQSCTTCPTGTYSSAGASSCMACPAGYSCVDGVMAACPPGYFSETGAGSCAACPAGHYCANGQKQPCAAGTWQHMAGQSACFNANPGQYVDRQGAVEPSPCVPGTYQPSSGQAACIPAPKGSFVGTSGATAPEQCRGELCAVLAGSTQCVLCPAGNVCIAHASCEAARTRCDDPGDNQFTSTTLRITRENDGALIDQRTDGCQGFRRLDWYCQGGAFASRVVACPKGHLCEGGTCKPSAGVLIRQFVVRKR